MLYNKSILILSHHTALPQFVSFQSNFAQSRIYMFFLISEVSPRKVQDWFKTDSKNSRRPQGSQGSIHSKAFGHCEQWRIQDFPLGGHQPPTWALFSENMRKQKNWILLGGGGMCWQCPPWFCQW